MKLSLHEINGGSMDDTIYSDGTYLENNESWHVEDSPWKAKQVLKMLRKHAISPERIGEVGCGAGEVLNQLAQALDKSRCIGYDLSPHAIALAAPRTSDRVCFRLGDISTSKELFDLVIAMDVMEHVEDCFAFVRKLTPLATYKMYHIPLDCNVLSVLRGWPIMEARSKVGHIHYFFKDTALATLKECGQEVIDWTFTASAIESEGAPTSIKARFLNQFRKGLFAVAPEFTVRVLGGYALLVLTK